MFESVKEEVAAARAADGGAAAIGRAFERVGRIGFWVQVMVAIGPIAVVAIVFGAVRGFGLPGGRMDLLGWLSLLSLLVLLFTTTGAAATFTAAARWSPGDRPSRRRWGGWCGPA